MEKPERVGTGFPKVACGVPRSLFRVTPGCREALCLAQIRAGSLRPRRRLRRPGAWTTRTERAVMSSIPQRVERAAVTGTAPPRPGSSSAYASCRPSMRGAAL